MSLARATRPADILFGRRNDGTTGAPRGHDLSGGPEVELLIGGIRIRLPVPAAAANEPATARAAAATE